jgi:hypothetical protein
MSTYAPLRSGVTYFYTDPFSQCIAPSLSGFIHMVRNNIISCIDSHVIIPFIVACHPYSRRYIKTTTYRGRQAEGGKEVEGAGWKGRKNRI